MSEAPDNLETTRLPNSVKLAFGAPGFAGAAMAIPIAVLMPRFYSDVILAPLGYVAVFIALARAFDALTDPFMGWLSDRTKTRWGRRKPYIAFGTPFTALAFYALFSPPESLSPIAASTWFGVSFGLFFLFSTIAEIPGAALGAEVTLDYNERSSLFAYRSFFVAAGMIVASILPSVLTQGIGIESERETYRIMASMYAVTVIVLVTIFLIRVPERRDFMLREPNPLVPGVRRALRNRPFLILLLAGTVNAIPAAIPAILMPYFVQYVLQPAEPLTYVGTYLVIYLGSGLLFVPFWLGAAKRIGKLKTLIVASSIGISGSLLYFFAGPGDTYYAGWIYFLTGTVSMAGTFLVPAMGADVIDYDELRTGKRREAQYTAFWALIPKFVSIPGSSIPLAILAAVGYVPNEVQTAEVMLWIRFMYSLFPAAFFVLALLIVARYPISEEIHAQIRAGIAAHGEGKGVLDPLTGNTLPARRDGAESEQQGWFLDYFSSGELHRALERGGSHLIRSVLVSAGLSLFVCAGAAAVAVSGMGAAREQPPLITVFSVVVAGLAFTALLFHCLRLPPARRMVTDPLPESVVRAHLDQLNGATPAAGPLPAA